MNFLKKFEQKMNRFAIGGIINYVCAMLAMGTVLYLVAPGFLNYLILNPIAIMHGQVWRILTFFVYPPAFTGGNPMGYILFNALAIYCIRSFGMIVEQVWGKFRFNCYIILGVLLNEAAVYIYYFVKGDIYTRVQIFVCILHMFIFFGWMVLAGETSYKQKKRQKDFQKKIKPMVSNKTGHKCAVCGRTDKDSPGMEFRYCSKCEGSYEYCMDHLYTHQHVKKPDSPQ